MKRSRAPLRVAMLAPIAWRTPPRHYGPWERVVSLLTEGLVAAGADVTLFATRDSRTSARLVAVCPRGYEEDPSLDAKVWEVLHVSEVFERAADFDLIHNHADFVPLAWSRLVHVPVVTTIHGFSSERILPVYRKYSGRVAYVAISEADRRPELEYVATIHHGIDPGELTFVDQPGDYLVFFGRIHPDKGAREAIEIARGAGLPLVIAGIVQDRAYFERHVEPHVDGRDVVYVGSVGRERRDELLGGALALLHPIAFEEPFGLSVVEAMACGTPVVAFRRGSMPELIRDGEHGFLVESVPEAIDAVGRVRGLARAACRKHVEERFTVARMVREYLDVYERVLAAWNARGGVRTPALRAART
ncbi:MAG TPA: glycosyltransferase family 4 protein [Longimicrobiales bacterium]|nr:glycosyltransferase family 4 protein [Longimicrobiales bacterium]